MAILYELHQGFLHSSEMGPRGDRSAFLIHLTPKDDGRRDRSDRQQRPQHKTERRQRSQQHAFTQGQHVNPTPDGQRNEFSEEYRQQPLQSDAQRHAHDAAEAPQEHALQQIHLHDETRVGTQRFADRHGHEFVFHESVNGAGDTNPTYEQRRQTNESQIRGQLIQKSPNARLGVTIR